MSAAPVQAQAPVAELKHPNFVATIQYGGDEQLSLEEWQPFIDKVIAKCSYWVIGKEVAPLTGQKHLQCYFQFKDRQRRSTLARLIPCYWAPQSKNSTADQAAEYCKKEGDFDSGGELKPVGQEALAAGRVRGGDANAERWKVARQTIENGDLKDLDDQIFVVHYGAVMNIRKANMKLPPALEWVDGASPNLWLYGKSGCGKSRKARQIAPNAYSKMCNKWWDGYQGQEDVIIDDFDIEHKVLCHHLKIWADRYPFVMEVKTGAQGIRPRRIIVTCNWSPTEIWENEKDLEPILRRFKVTNMSPGALLMPLPATVSTFTQAPTQDAYSGHQPMPEHQPTQGEEEEEEIFVVESSIN